jgi:probable HAF family extracellular repeat protein
MNTWIRALGVLTILTLIPAFAGAADPVVELPTLGGSYAVAEDVNDLGKVVGWSERVGGAVEATMWSSGVPSSLGLPPAARFSFANAINNVGEVAGYSEIGFVPGDPGNARSATFWGTSGVVDIGAQMEFEDSIAFDINDGGTVVLQADHPGEFGFFTGWVWSEAFGGIPAGPDPLYRFGANFGINDLNDVVGYGAVGFDGHQAILARFNGRGWDNGIEIGPQAVRSPAIANAISNNGIIVGEAGDDGVHVFEAAMFTLDKTKPVVWLDTLDDFEDSSALDVNDAGLVVGFAERYVQGVPERRAVVWVDEQIYDLNHLLRKTSRFRVLTNATGVNAVGDVVGYGVLHGGETRPFIIRELGKGPTSGLFGHPRTPADL